MMPDTGNFHHKLAFLQPVENYKNFFWFISNCHLNLGPCVSITFTRSQSLQLGSSVDAAGSHPLLFLNPVVYWHLLPSYVESTPVWHQFDSVSCHSQIFIKCFPCTRYWLDDGDKVITNVNMILALMLLMFTCRERVRNMSLKNVR
jgi:hypothetical protein